MAVAFCSCYCAAMSTVIVTQNTYAYQTMAQDEDLGTAGGTTATKSLVVAGSQSVKVVEVDNTANTSAASYVKVFNEATTGAVTLGSTAPVAILYAPMGEKVCYTVPAGMAFSAGIVWTCVTTPGTAGTTPPGSKVVARLFYG